MRISIKCSSAVHILLMIAELSPTTKVTSELLASSIGSNPVEIRKLLGNLKNAGIVTIVRGTGGATLTKDPKQISLFDIYSAVDSNSLDSLIGVHMHPSKQCPFGKNIFQLLSEPYTQIGNAVKDTMISITLDQLIARLYEIDPSFKHSLP